MKRSLIVLAAVLTLAACGDERAPTAPAAPTDPGLIHIHGLGVDPADGALYVATHTGLFRAAEGEPELQRVGPSQQDTMGFSVVGPNRFIGSGHPGVGQDDPPFLGLIASEDAGVSWQPVSLLGKTDFHVLEAAGERVYGYGSDFETRTATFLVSPDAGRTWKERTVPEPLVALAIDPGDPDHVVASSERQTFASRDAGRTWRPLADAAGLLAWTESGELHLAAFDGTTARSDDGGATWTPTGQLGGSPAAFEAAEDTLYAALHDGTIKQSGDGGRTWTIRSAP
jgi:hypothetical protein